MMRRLFAMIRNEFQREFAYPLSILFFLILPLLFTAAVGAGLGGMSGGDAPPEEYRTHLYVRGDDADPLVNAFLAALEEVNLTVEVVETLPQESFGLEVPADFAARLRAGETVTLTLHTQPTSASQAVEQYVQAAAGRLGGAVLIAEMGVAQAEELDLVTTPAERQVFFDTVLTETLDAALRPPTVAEVRWSEGIETAESSTAMVTGTEQASAGQLVTWVQITLLGAAEVLVDERQRGTLKRLLVAPAGRATILGGKLLARLTLGLTQMALLLVGGALLFGVGWGQQPAATALVSFAFALATVGLGVLVATFVRTRGQANSIVVGLAMGLAALGGAWWPLEVTPPLYRQVVNVLPTTWAMRAYTDLLARGATTLEILPSVAVLLGFAALFMTVGLWRFRHYP
ncbi:MAG: ABC transporter permease [Anaerolineae bacterium]